MEFGIRLCELRRRQGLSQEALAERLGVTRQAVSKWETGESLPDIDRLIALSEVFCVSTDYLVKGTEPQASAAPEPAAPAAPAAAPDRKTDAACRWLGTDGRGRAGVYHCMGAFYHDCHLPAGRIGEAGRGRCI